MNDTSARRAGPVAGCASASTAPTPTRPTRTSSKCEGTWGAHYDTPVLDRAVHGVALHEPRRDGQRVAPERDPWFGVPPVALGGVGDAGQRRRLARQRAADADGDAQGSVERWRISSSRGSGTRMN